MMHGQQNVKNTLVSHGLLQFIQNNVNWNTSGCHYWETLTQIYSLKQHPSCIIHRNQSTDALDS